MSGSLFAAYMVPICTSQCRRKTQETYAINNDNHYAFIILARSLEVVQGHDDDSFGTPHNQGPRACL